MHEGPSLPIMSRDFSTEWGADPGRQGRVGELFGLAHGIVEMRTELLALLVVKI